MTSLWRLMLCKLQFAHDRDSAVAKKFKRGNTFTALGSAAHKLEELVHKGEFDATEDSAIPSAVIESWNQLIDNELIHLQAQWPEYEPLRPRDLPKYAHVFCNATDRAIDLVRRRRARNPGGPRIEVEKTLVDETLRIEGRPDRYVVTGNSFSVVDIKSGAASAEIQPAHRHQLLTYRHLISEATGLTPTSIQVQDVEGNLTEEHVTPEVVATHIARVVNSRDDFLTILGDAAGFSRHAQPSSDSCRFCNYRVICSSYWTLPDGERQKDDFIGTVEVIPRAGAITVKREQFLEGEPEYVTIIGYKPSIEIGSRIAVSGGYLHQNVMRAGIGTTIFTITGH